MIKVIIIDMLNAMMKVITQHILVQYAILVKKLSIVRMVIVVLKKFLIMILLLILISVSLRVLLSTLRRMVRNIAMFVTLLLVFLVIGNQTVSHFSIGFTQF